MSYQTFLEEQSKREYKSFIDTAKNGRKRSMQLWEAYLLLNNPKTAYTKEELEEAKRLVSVESVDTGKERINADSN